jgi:hypothetical protein
MQSFEKESPILGHSGHEELVTVLHTAMVAMYYACLSYSYKGLSQTFAGGKDRHIQN